MELDRCTVNANSSANDGCKCSHSIHGSKRHGRNDGRYDHTLRAIMWKPVLYDGVAHKKISCLQAHDSDTALATSCGRLRVGSMHHEATLCELVADRLVSLVWDLGKCKISIFGLRAIKFWNH